MPRYRCFCCRCRGGYCCSSFLRIVGNTSVVLGRVRVVDMARKVSRNPELIRGVGKYSRSQMYHRRGLWAIKAKNGGVLPRHDPKPKPVAASEKPSKYYPADDVKKPLVNKHKPRPTQLRASITPGTVLIILAGRFKGKRAVFLKQLSSGLLLITGPFKINVEKKKTNSEGEFFEAEKEEKNMLPEVKKEDQKSIDALLLKSIFEGFPRRQILKYFRLCRVTGSSSLILL
ncbi:hypothetical protein MLD38_005197 [Melastoma candidum]|uniref:Uncharacterized protein n=1 Tax=Melastoma candidum TaxID=119954 RepID=A0ACB9S879_9MYRT|nr:hypothetical protein MLD38_005197 [Melastoma candidum]